MTEAEVIHLFSAMTTISEQIEHEEHSEGTLAVNTQV